jgi:CTP:molybdopterin cytidylyltransferase MocA
MGNPAASAAAVGRLIAHNRTCALLRTCKTLALGAAVVYAVYIPTMSVRQRGLTPLGTAHAVRAAEAALADFDGDVVILYGDTPLLRAATIEPMFQRRAEGAALVVLGFAAMQWTALRGAEPIKRAAA